MGMGMIGLFSLIPCDLGGPYGLPEEEGMKYSLAVEDPHKPFTFEMGADRLA